MPLESIHKFAFKAAQATECAAAEGKYWEMHDRLFANQQAFEPWNAHAEAVGIDTAKFESCLAGGKYDAEIRRQAAEAGKAGVTGTPGFLIGRTEPNSNKMKILAVLKGARPFADFKAELDRQLADADKPAPAAAAGGPAAAPGAGTPSGAAAAAAAPARPATAADGKLDQTTRASLAAYVQTVAQASRATPSRPSRPSWW